MLYQAFRRKEIPWIVGLWWVAEEMSPIQTLKTPTDRFWKRSEDSTDHVASPGDLPHISAGVLENAKRPNSLSHARSPTRKRVLRVTLMVYKQLVIVASTGNPPRPRCVFRRPTLHIEERSTQV